MTVSTRAGYYSINITDLQDMLHILQDKLQDISTKKHQLGGRRHSIAGRIINGGAVLRYDVSMELGKLSANKCVHAHIDG